MSRSTIDVDIIIRPPSTGQRNLKITLVLVSSAQRSGSLMLPSSTVGTHLVCLAVLIKTKVDFLNHCPIIT